MFSDVSDDEPDFNGRTFLKWNQPWPPLLLYEEEEDEARHKEVARLRRKVVAPQKSKGRDYYRQHQTWRFLDSIIGYHIGDLDLAGRHLPRYEKLMSRWNVFLYDFNELSLTVELKQSEKNEGVDYILTDPEKWNSFARKWHVSRSAGYKALVDPIREVREQLHDTPSPKIQVICLHNLPTEILDYIYQCFDIEDALEDSRIFSSVCRKLRDIGKRYIFVSRTLDFSFPEEFYTQLYDKSDAECAEVILSVIGRRKELFLDYANFLISRPDLASVADSLSITNSVRSTIAEDTDDVDHDRLLDVECYRPINDAFANVILSCKNIQNLTLSCLELTVEILQAISTLPNLIVLKYIRCIVTSHVETSVHAEEMVRPNHSVMNLEIHDVNISHGNPWVLVELYPSLRTLFIGNRHSRWVLEPPRLVFQKSLVFPSLERLCIDGLCYEGVLLLAQWIRFNAVEAPLQLTHLKITAPYGIPDMFLFELVDALETAPLQALVFDGIKDGSLELFDIMAEKLTHLLGLILMRRENYRQYTLKPATWPYATYQYAPHFSGFKSLQHFSWNFRLPKFCEYTPASMMFIEDRFPTVPENFGWRGEKDGLYDNHYVAYPFAAYCPTLKSFGANQRIKLVLVGYSCRIMERWDTVDEAHWPYIQERADITKL